MMRRKSQKMTETDEKIKTALKELANGTYKTPYTVANALEINPATVYCRAAGGKSRAEEKANQQNLSQAEEKALMQ